MDSISCKWDLRKNPTSPAAVYTVIFFYQNLKCLPLEFLLIGEESVITSNCSPFLVWAVFLLCVSFPSCLPLHHLFLFPATHLTGQHHGQLWLTSPTQTIPFPLPSIPTSLTHPSAETLRYELNEGHPWKDSTVAWLRTSFGVKKFEIESQPYQLSALWSYSFASIRPSLLICKLGKLTPTSKVVRFKCDKRFKELSTMPALLYVLNKGTLFCDFSSYLIPQTPSNPFLTRAHSQVKVS